MPSRLVLTLAVISLLALLQCSLAHASGLFDFQMKLAQKGNAEAQFKVGEMYETGFEVEKSMQQAEIWINKAADQGHIVAGYKLLYWDLQKNGITESNRTRLEVLKQKAESGNDQAQYYIGKMRANGVGLNKNLTMAQDLLNKAAIQGVLEAERELIRLRDDIQREQLAKRKAEEKRKAKLKAQQQEEQRRKQQAAAAAAAETARQQEARRKANEKARAKARQEAQQQAEARRAREDEAARLKEEREQLEREREARRQALLTERKAKEEQRKAQFESDPCAGKSARFLSTCR